MALEDEEARESIEDDCPASPPRRTSSSHSPRAVISPETGANRRYKSRRIASSSEDDDDDENADYFSDADDRHAGFAVSPSRLHTRPNGGNGPGTPVRREHVTRRTDDDDAAVLRRVPRLPGGGSRADLAVQIVIAGERGKPRVVVHERPIQRREPVADVTGDAHATKTILELIFSLANPFAFTPEVRATVANINITPRKPLRRRSQGRQTPPPSSSRVPSTPPPPPRRRTRARAPRAPPPSSSSPR